MKNTIKITPYKRIVIEANKFGLINFDIVQGLVGGVTTTEMHQLTPDQAGAMVSALQWEAVTAENRFVESQLRQQTYVEKYAAKSAA